jgi:hypothetical protein
MVREGAEKSQSEPSCDDSTFERHFSISDLAELWRYGRETIRLLVKDEPGVLKIRLGRNKMLTHYSVPESVARRIHTRLLNPPPCDPPNNPLWRKDEIEIGKAEDGLAASEKVTTPVMADVSRELPSPAAGPARLAPNKPGAHSKYSEKVLDMVRADKDNAVIAQQIRKDRHEESGVITRKELSRVRGLKHYYRSKPGKPELEPES